MLEPTAISLAGFWAGMFAVGTAALVKMVFFA